MINTNHEKIYYRPFRKDFYTVVPEIANMTDEGKLRLVSFSDILTDMLPRSEVKAYREELDGIKVVGKRCPRPIKTWSQCITSDKILQAMRKSVFYFGSFRFDSLRSSFQIQL